jgi:hypothetical protein
MENSHALILAEALPVMLKYILRRLGTKKTRDTGQTHRLTAEYIAH